MSDFNINESWLEAMRIVAESEIQKVSFDQTIKATVLNDEKAEEGRYWCTNGYSEFWAYSAEVKYRNQDKVLVTVPQGDYSNQKVIISKQADESNSPIFYMSPFSTMVDLTNNIIPGEHEQDIWANEGRMNSMQDSFYSWDMNAKLFQDSAAFKYGTPFFDSSKNTEPLFEKGITRLGLQAQFSTWLSEYSTISGNYGIALELTFRCTDLPEGTVPTLLKTAPTKKGVYYTKSGDKYNKITTSQLNYITDNSHIPDCIEMIADIEGKQKQTGKFKLSADSDFVPLYELKVVNEFTKYITFDSDEFFGDVYAYESFYTNETVFDLSQFEEYALVRVRAWFYQRDNFQTMLGEYVPAPKITEFSDINPNIFMKDPLICLGVAAEQFVDDKAAIVTESSLNFYKNVNRSLEEIMQEEIKLLEQDYLDGLIASQEILDKKIDDLKKSYEIMTEQEKEEKRKTSNEKIIKLKWIHKDENTKVIRLVEEEKYPEDYEIRWYRWALGASSPDQFAGAHWVRFYGCKDSANDEGDYCISEEEYNNYLATDSPYRAWMLENDPTNELLIHFKPNINRSQEKIKAIIVKKETQVLTTYVVEDGSTKTEEVEEDTMYRLAAATNEIVFLNDDEVRNQQTYIDINALSVRFDDESNGRYFLYNRAGNVSRTADLEIRTLTAVFDEVETDVYLKSEIPPNTKCKWTFPVSNTMIIPATSSNLDAQQTTQTVFTDTPSVGYFIKKSLNRADNNNTVQLEAIISGVTYTAEGHMFFGTAGTSGSDYTLDLVWKNDIALDVTDPSSGLLIGEVGLFDSAGNQLLGDDDNISDISTDYELKYEWEVGEVIPIEGSGDSSDNYDFIYEENDILYPTFPSDEYATFYNDGTGQNNDQTYGGYYYFVDDLISLGKQFNYILADTTGSINFESGEFKSSDGIRMPVQYDVNNLIFYLDPTVGGIKTNDQIAKSSSTLAYFDLDEEKFIYLKDAFSENLSADIFENIANGQLYRKKNSLADLNVVAAVRNEEFYKLICDILWPGENLYKKVLDLYYNTNQDPLELKNKRKSAEDIKISESNYYLNWDRVVKTNLDDKTQAEKTEEYQISLSQAIAAYQSALDSYYYQNTLEKQTLELSQEMKELLESWEFNEDSESQNENQAELVTDVDTQQDIIIENYYKAQKILYNKLLTDTLLEFNEEQKLQAIEHDESFQDQPEQFYEELFNSLFLVPNFYELLLSHHYELSLNYPSSIDDEIVNEVNTNSNVNYAQVVYEAGVNGKARFEYIIQNMVSKINSGVSSYIIDAYIQDNNVSLSNDNSIYRCTIRIKDGTSITETLVDTDDNWRFDYDWNKPKFSFKALKNVNGKPEDADTDWVSNYGAQGSNQKDTWWRAGRQVVKDNRFYKKLASALTVDETIVTQTQLDDLMSKVKKMNTDWNMNNSMDYSTTLGYRIGNSGTIHSFDDFKPLSSTDTTPIEKLITKLKTLRNSNYKTWNSNLQWFDGNTRLNFTTNPEKEGWVYDEINKILFTSETTYNDDYLIDIFNKARTKLPANTSYNGELKNFYEHYPSYAGNYISNQSVASILTDPSLTSVSEQKKQYEAMQDKWEMPSETDIYYYNYIEKPNNFYRNLISLSGITLTGDENTEDNAKELLTLTLTVPSEYSINSSEKMETFISDFYIGDYLKLNNNEDDDINNLLISFLPFERKLSESRVGILLQDIYNNRVNKIYGKLSTDEINNDILNTGIKKILLNELTNKDPNSNLELTISGQHEFLSTTFSATSSDEIEKNIPLIKSPAEVAAINIADTSESVRYIYKHHSLNLKDLAFGSETVINIAENCSCYQDIRRAIHEALSRSVVNDSVEYASYFPEIYSAYNYIYSADKYAISNTSNANNFKYTILLNLLFDLSLYSRTENYFDTNIEYFSSSEAANLPEMWFRTKIGKAESTNYTNLSFKYNNKDIYFKTLETNISGEYITTSLLPDSDLLAAQFVNEQNWATNFTRVSQSGNGRYSPYPFLLIYDRTTEVTSSGGTEPETRYVYRTISANAVLTNDEFYIPLFKVCTGNSSFTIENWAKEVIPIWANPDSSARCIWKSNTGGYNNYYTVPWRQDNKFGQLTLSQPNYISNSNWNKIVGHLIFFSWTDPETNTNTYSYDDIIEWLSSGQCYERNGTVLIPQLEYIDLLVKQFSKTGCEVVIGDKVEEEHVEVPILYKMLMKNSVTDMSDIIFSALHSPIIFKEVFPLDWDNKFAIDLSQRQLFNREINGDYSAKTVNTWYLYNATDYYIDIRDIILQTIFNVKQQTLKNVSDISVAKLEVEENMYQALATIYNQILEKIKAQEILCYVKTPFNSLTNYYEQFYTILFDCDHTKGSIYADSNDNIYLYNVVGDAEHTPYWYNSIYPLVNYQAGLISYIKKTADISFNATPKNRLPNASEDIYLGSRFKETTDANPIAGKIYYYYNGENWQTWSINTDALTFDGDYDYLELVPSPDSKPKANKIYIANTSNNNFGIWFTLQENTNWPDTFTNPYEFVLTTDSSPESQQIYYIINSCTYSWIPWKTNSNNETWNEDRGLPSELKQSTDVTPIPFKIYFQQKATNEWETWYTTVQNQAWSGARLYELTITTDQKPVANKQYYYSSSYSLDIATWSKSADQFIWDSNKPYEIDSNVVKISNKLKLQNNKLTLASIKTAIQTLNVANLTYYDSNNKELTAAEAFKKLANIVFENYTNISLSDWLNLIINSMTIDTSLILQWDPNQSEIAENFSQYYFLKFVDSSKNILYNLKDEWEKCFSSEDNSLIDIAHLSKMLEYINNSENLIQPIPLNEMVSTYSLSWLQTEALALWSLASLNIELPLMVSDKIADILINYDKLNQNFITAIKTAFQGYTIQIFEPEESEQTSYTMEEVFSNTGSHILEQLVNGYTKISKRANTIYIDEEHASDDITIAFNSEVFNYENQSIVHNIISDKNQTIQRKPFIKVNDYYIVDPYKYWRPDEVYYQPEQTKPTSSKAIPLVYSPKGDKKRTVWIYPRTGLTSEQLMSSLSVLKVTLTKFGDYDLIAYFPIALKNGTVIRKTDNTILFTPAYIEGATYVRYSTMGETDYEKNPYRAFSRQIIQDDKGNTVVDRDSLLYLDDQCGWQLLYPTPESEFSNFIPSLAESKQQIEAVTINEKKYKYQLPLLHPIPVYIPDATPYGICYFYHHNATQKANYTVGTSEVSIPIWSQAIYQYEDNYPSTTLNQWNGKDIKTDDKTGSIVASAIAAGKKERDNTFTGVMLGDWSRTDTDVAITKQTGLFGFNHGSMAYAFKDDGTGFIGKDGRGRIIFDGNKSTIYSNNWKGKYQAGMYLDVDDGIIKLHSDPLSLANGTEFVFYHTTQNLPAIDEKGNFPLSDETAWSLRFLLSAAHQAKYSRTEVIEAVKNILLGNAVKEVTFYNENGEAYAQAYPPAGTKLYVKNTADQQRYITLSSKEYTYPLAIGTDKRVSQRKFRVTWDGVAHIDEGHIHGMIYANGGEINGDMNVNGTLTGGKLVGSYIEGSTIVGSHVEADYLKANQAGEIAGWTITETMLRNVDGSTVLMGKIKDATTYSIITNKIGISAKAVNSETGNIVNVGGFMGWVTGATASWDSTLNQFTNYHETELLGIQATSGQGIALEAGAGNIGIRTTPTNTGGGIWIHNGYQSGMVAISANGTVSIKASKLCIYTEGSSTEEKAKNQQGIYARFA